MKMVKLRSSSSSISTSSSTSFPCASVSDWVASMFPINSSSSEKEMVAQWYVNSVLMPCELLHRQLDQLRAKQERKIQHQKHLMRSLFRKLPSRERKVKKEDDERSAFNQLLATGTGMPASVFAVFDHFEDNDVSPDAKGESALPKASQPVPGATTSSAAAADTTADADAAAAADATDDATDDAAADAASAMDSDKEDDCSDCGKHHPGEKECPDYEDESSPDGKSESEHDHDADPDHDTGVEKDSTVFKYKGWNKENVKNYMSLVRAKAKLSSCTSAFTSSFDSPSSSERFSELASK